MLKYIYILVFLFAAQAAHSETISTYTPITLSDSSQVSILTNSPTDKAVYTMYGHTVVRVKDFKQNIDIAFNYGVFDFSNSDFLYRFIKGETYYWVEPEMFSHFKFRYSFQEVGIVEQVLDITPEDKQKVWNSLCINSLEENKVYLYNFFFDNCATRPRDIIENNISSNIYYPETEDDKTFRDLVHECVHSYPWVEFGIDLLIGSPADVKAETKDRMFLPIYLKNIYAQTNISDSIGLKPIVLQENIITPSTSSTHKDPKPYPLIIGILLLVVTFVISFWVKNNTVKKAFDFTLFFIAGVAGSIIFFLMFFSIHPCMTPNWNIVWLNPLMLIVALILPLKMCAKYVYYYHFINFVVLALFSLAWFLIPQTLSIAFLPFILSLCLRSGANVLIKSSALHNTIKN